VTPRVLIVEDYEEASESLAMLLRRFGFDVTVAADGPSACTAPRDRPPDMLLTDQAMPAGSTATARTKHSFSREHLGPSGRWLDARHALWAGP
jgi:CheY-like chemotaxis protein